MTDQKQEVPDFSAVAIAAAPPKVEDGSWLNAVAFLNSIAEDPVYGRFGGAFIATADLLSRLARELAEAKAGLMKSDAVIADACDKGYLQDGHPDDAVIDQACSRHVARQAKKGESE